MNDLAATQEFPGRDAVAKRGWLAAHKYLLLRRLSQFAIFALFLIGPLAGIWIVKGSLSASLLLGVLPMTDPFVMVQSLAAGHWPERTAWFGVAVVIGFYLVAGGRSYCSWVCPINVVTDTAGWLRRRLGIRTGKTPSRSLRFWLLGASLVAALVSGTAVWEWVNPVTMAQRALIFGGFVPLLLAGAILVYDLFISPRGWCGYVCPMGACYNLIGKAALVRIAADGREKCNDCLDCFAICPEPQVIRPALKGPGTPLITASDCTNCGRCIDVCAQSVFSIAIRTQRFDNRRESS